MTVGPGAFEGTVRDGESFYRAERPLMADWTFSPQCAALVKAPVPVPVLGTLSGAWFEDGDHLIRRRFPQSAHVDIPDTNHLLYLQAPKRSHAKWLDSCVVTHACQLFADSRWHGGGAGANPRAPRSSTPGR